MISTILYILRTSLYLGSASFGGYMSLVSVLREKMVERDKMITDEVLAEGITLATLIPGPMAVNVLGYVSFRLAGVWGALTSVFGVLFPSFCLMLLLSWLYFDFKQIADFQSLLNGIIPVVIGIIFSVSLTMARNNCRAISKITLAVISGVSLFFFRDYWFMLGLLVVSAAIGILFFKPKAATVQAEQQKASPWKNLLYWILLFILVLICVRVLLPHQLIGQIFTTFSSISLTLFGGGYVMIPVLKSILVDQLTWCTYDEFTYGISIGQVTPGPILISSVFFGFKLGGVWGALVATLGIFLPSVFLMLVLSSVYSRIRSNVYVQGAVQALKATVVGMIVYSGISMLKIQFVSAPVLPTIILVLISFLLIFRFKIVPSLLIVAGAIVGYLFEV